ncbi:MAG TPA: YdeI/OmpD-associated family protein [Thermoflexales bacterium]|nr:YdeI/OmpD-associated family protein [Thermoflexales bacterium]HQY24801.1 YdeI/OmpD-associated family protein [Thermoflexales bacterium]HQZ54646.1 YdeI/OmpD-associated family protein [Thermoflexales bacterium]HRA54903.1 YdeI/OmpD-associated family protein [Thermoflexales bacterium]
MKAANPPTFFDTPIEFRAWLARHHASAEELWVGFRKKGTGKPSISWPESVDQALCFGWIDGLRKTIDADAYMIRFTPRRAGSTWSAVNIAKVATLTAAGLMQSAGLRAFEARIEEKSGIYSYETRPEALPEPYAAILRKNQAAWDDFRQRSPSYRRGAIGWVISAKAEATRLRRLAILIGCSAKGEPIPHLDRRPGADPRR